MDGTPPCTNKEAIKFAALQCQVQFGNHDKTKHKPSFLQLAEFLPREYAKIKGIEKKIFVEHCRLHNLSEMDAMFQYIQCQSLKTDGVIHFLVKVRLS